MASALSSIGNASSGKFEVFINHRGIDVKTSLASTIHDTLDLIGVRAFLDIEELEAGEEIWDTIKEAISNALVHVAIFSPKYAQSRWCLDELTLMLQTGKKIIPIFYHVEPCHLRWVAQGMGVYSEAFSKHEQSGRYPPQQLKEWKEALNKASHISGLEVNNRNNYEGHLLKHIAKIVISEIRNNQLLDVGRHPVGLDTAIENFENFVKTHFDCTESKQNVTVVGIVGMGGCGKTTLAKEYFNRKRSSYQSSSFLFDVKDAAAKKSLHDLQKKLLEDLLHLRTLNFHHKSEGKRTLEDRVRSVKALIILDDVDHLEQMDALLPLKGNLRSDSLIVVTTRDKGLIESSASLSPSVSPYLYKIGGLDPIYAKELFCWHVFLQDSPVKGFEDLVEEFLNACQGLPLSLKVIGGQLYGNNSRDYWESVLHKISKILHEDIKQTLKVSYDALDEEQQQMFLDVACFFIGEQKDMAISIWDGSGWDGFLWSGWYGFQILENKCLVEVDHQNCIRMHDHLRDLGREIAIKKTPSRFWSPSQFVNSQRPLKERLPIRGVMAATGSMDYRNLHYEQSFGECMQLLMGHSTSRYSRLTPSAFGLQLLVVRGDYFKEQFAKLSEELVWLRWYDFPHGKLPSWLSTGKLRVLELCQPKGLAELWGPNDAPPSQLRELIINMSGFCKLQMIPETIGSLKHLKKIALKRGVGRGEIEISSLPEEFCLLESLEHLELPGFSYLSSLPGDFGKLRKLKYIDLSGCRRLTGLPVSFNQLTELQYLDLSWCEDLHLEKGILGNITKLVKLRLCGCFELQPLPSEITRQMYLRELCLSSVGLRTLPADIDRLTKLEVLEIRDRCLTSLPTSLGNLSSLIKLRIEYCRQLNKFPSLGNLSCLIELTICDCREVKHLPPVGCLHCLENLELRDLDVEYLPQGFGQLGNLQNIEILDCPIRELPLANHVDSSILKPERLRRLKSIWLGGTKVATISISEYCCPNLQDLYLFANYDLMEIETLPTTLKNVQISSCEKLKNIRCVAGLPKLQDLKINDCPGLDELPSFAALVELQRLWIQECGQLHKLPNIAGLVELRYFLIEECPELDELPSFACCTSLEELKIKVPRRVTKIEGLQELRSLKTLRLETYWKVAGIKGLKNLDKLTELQIRAESRSAIERCIPPNIVKRAWACRMDIVGRAVEDVESVIGSLSFPTFTVVDKLHHPITIDWTIDEWQMKAPVWNASCVIVCFVISCRSQGAFIFCDVGSSLGSYRSIPEDFGSIPSLEGKQLYIGVFPKGFYMEGSQRVFLTLRSHRVQIEKGMAVIMGMGKEKKALEPLNKILELLER